MSTISPESAAHLQDHEVLLEAPGQPEQRASPEVTAALASLGVLERQDPAVGRSSNYLELGRLIHPF